MAKNRDLIYRRILAALMENEMGLAQPALVFWVHSSGYVGKKCINSYLQHLSKVEWVVRDSGLWKVTALGKTASTHNFVLSKALEGKNPESPVKTEEASEPSAMREIEHFSREWMPERPASVAWLYRSGVGV
ncbi:hypothetical protein [Thiothrix eikelboomii]|nr:hypothetical protein [Thiothrix eikelboomii]